MPALRTPSFSVRSYPAGGGQHAHGHAQAVLPLHGAMSLAIGPREGLVRDDVGVLIPAGALHRFGASGPNRFVVLDFDCEAAVGSFFTLDPALAHLLHYVHDIAGPERGGRLAPDIDRHATALLCDAVRSRTRTDAAAGPTPALQQALAWMQQHLDQPLRVADIARVAGLSASHLHAEFRRQLGRSPARHLAELRLDAALAQLRGTDLPIAQIALRCGYSEQSALNRALRQRLGTTPSALRRS